MHSLRPALRIIAVALLALGVAPPAFAQTTRNELFFIGHSKNANEVHYDARLAADGILERSDPVDAYLLKKAEDGSRQAVSALQKIAYGWSIDANADGTYTMKLKSFPDRPLTLVRAKGRWRAQLLVAAKQAYLNHIYIATDEAGAMPKVLYIEIFGQEVGSGAAIQERIVKN
jgi:Domain of unknown function (DUF4833)